MALQAVVVEDEPITRQTLATLLRAQGWQVWEASDAAAFDAIMRDEMVDLALVDLGLPGRSGQDLIAQYAQANALALLAVTARWEPAQRIAVLEAGADDYIVKPFHEGELIARINAVLRRRKVQTGSIITIQQWQVDLDTRLARFSHEKAQEPQADIALTRGEASILALLAEADGRIVSRERLSKAAARSTQDGDLRTVDTLIYRLRRKFTRPHQDGSMFIMAVAGLGYRLVKTQTAPSP